MLDWEAVDTEETRAARLWNMLRIVVAMLRKGISAKKLQKMAMDLQMAIKSLKVGRDRHFFDKKTIGFNDHYEFSCSSTPMVKRVFPSNAFGLKKSNSRRWDQRFLMATMPCIEKEAESVIHSTIPKIVECSEDKYSCKSNISTPSTYITARRSNSGRSELSEIDRQAEEFIASFYRQMSLQRQDSFTKYREMLARGSG